MSLIKLENELKGVHQTKPSHDSDELTIVQEHLHFLSKVIGQTSKLPYFKRGIVEKKQLQELQTRVDNMAIHIAGKMYFYGQC